MAAVFASDSFVASTAGSGVVTTGAGAGGVGATVLLRTGPISACRFAADYFTLLDRLTIARSRKHVGKYYGTAETGRFPDRLKPINIKADVDVAVEFQSIREINNEIRRLNLASYAPRRYVLPHKQAAYDKKYSTEIRGGEGFFRPPSSSTTASATTIRRTDTTTTARRRWSATSRCTAGSGGQARGTARGSKGDAAPPRQMRNVAHCVGWLMTSTRHEPAVPVRRFRRS